jgi:hypothetical protein
VNALEAIRDLVQQDPGRRGLATVPGDNLLTACADDFAFACRSIAEERRASLAIVTGFFIPTAEPPAGETDGPLGALFLARALAPAGIRVAILTDPFCVPALQAGLAAAGLAKCVPLVVLPRASDVMSAAEYPRLVLEALGPVTHLIALERVGPSHTPATLHDWQGASEHLIEEFREQVPPQDRGRCHTMRGRDITTLMRPAHLLFETPAAERPITIGIGDGGNEIGMGRIAWNIIRRNIERGAVVACRTPVDHLVVCGVSNWGAYALATGVLRLRGVTPPGTLFDPRGERDLLQIMVESGPLVDGVLGHPAVSVDGLSIETYAAVLSRLATS